VRIIALPGEKGGIGKTTTTVNLGAALVEMGRRVLLLNADPQVLCVRSVGVVVSDLVWPPNAALLGYTSLTKTELIVRSSFGKLRTGFLDRFGAGSFGRLRAGPAARQCHHRDRRAAHPPGPRSPPHPYTDNAGVHDRRRPHIRRQPQPAGSEDRGVRYRAWTNPF